jgi:hypothetical protein
MLGDIDFALNNINSAFLDYKNILTFDSVNVYALFMCGLTCELMSKYDSAVVYYKRAAFEKSKSGFIVDESDDFKKLDPEKSYDVSYDKIRLRKGIASYFRRDLKECLNDLGYCIGKKYMLPEALLYRGFCFLDLGLSKDGCKDLEDAKSYGNKSADEYIVKYCGQKKD